MAKRPTLTDVTSLTNSSNINAINQNWDAIQTAFDNTLSLDGSTPNAMNSDLDLNGNSLLNVDTLDVDGLTLNGQTVTGLATVPEWRGAWASGQGYVINDLVKTAGNVYICLVAHTAGGDFNTDLTADNWELFVSKGDSGSGAGDMLSTNNLSDVANPATSRTNLGLGTVAVENTVPVAKGGTGATDATTARTNLSAQTLNANLTSLSGITLAQGDLLYATGPDTLVRLPKGSAGQVLRMNTGATAPEWTTNSGIMTLFQTLSVSTGATVETDTFNEDKSYIFQFVGVRHSAGLQQNPTLAIFGDTANAYSSAVAASGSINNGSYGYGHFKYLNPKVSRNLHTVDAAMSGNGTAPGSNSALTSSGVIGTASSFNWGTAQTVSKVRFGWTGGANFVNGNIIIWEF